MQSNILKSKNFFLFFLGAFVSDIGNVFYNFATSWFILEITGSAQAAGIYMATGSIVYLILVNFGSSLVDRMDKVKIMYVTDFIRGITISMAGFIIMTSDTHVVIISTLYVTTIIIAATGALFGPSYQSIVKYIVPEENLQQANAYLGMKGALQNIMGMLVAGIVYAALGIAWVFIINGVSFILSGISEIFIKADTKEIKDTPLTFKNVLLDIIEGWKYLYSKQKIFRLMGVSVLFNLGFMMLISIGLPYFFNQSLALHPSYLTTVHVTMSVAAIIVAMILSKKPQPDKMYHLLRKNILGLTLSFYGITTVMILMLNTDISFVLGYSLLLFTFFLTSMFNNAIGIPLQTIFIKEFDKNMMARAMTVIQVIAMAVFPLAAVFGGVLIEVVGMTVFLMIAGGVLVVPTVLIYVDKKFRTI